MPVADPVPRALPLNLASRHKKHEFQTLVNFVELFYWIWGSPSEVPIHARMHVHAMSSVVPHHRPIPRQAA